MAARRSEEHRRGQHYSHKVATFRRKLVTVCVWVRVCLSVSQGQAMTNDGKLEWRLPAACSPCQQKIRGKEASEKMAVTHTYTHTHKTNTHRALIHKLAGAQAKFLQRRMSCRGRGGDSQRGGSLRALISRFLHSDWFCFVFFNLSKCEPSLWLS